MPKADANTGQPRFPYTTQPKALRRLLTEIPKRPKPPKITRDTLKAWNVSNVNDTSPVNVLKKLGLLGQAGEPTNLYVDFMKTGTGPLVLAERIREVYKALYENSHAPQSDSDEELKKLFNIHSGGGEDAMRYQLQTFKTLSEYANFSSPPDENKLSLDGVSSSAASVRQLGQLPPIQVDLHIHLPENKTSRDYEAIIQDIARYIYGRDVQKS
jgi:hypothetical protein